MKTFKDLVRSQVPSIPRLRPQLQVGCLFDVPGGHWRPGKEGHYYLNSGLSLLNSIAGPGNSFKTAIMLWLNLSAAERYASYDILAYDSENSLSYDRINNAAMRFPKLSQIDFNDEDQNDRFVITSGSEMLGDEYFDSIREMAKEKRGKELKLPLLTMPILDKEGKPFKTLPITGVIIDSLSNFEITSINDKMVGVNSIGDSKNNMMFMKGGVAKKQMLTQLPGIAAKSGLTFNMVAHVGDEFELDQYAPKKHKLTHSKRGSKITGTTKGFEFLNNFLYEIFNVSPLNNSKKGTGVQYPLGDLDKDEDACDLLLATLKITRNKHGPSGIMLQLILSQREGLLPELSQFHYLKTNDYGIHGNAQNYALDMRPDVKLSRTTVREKIDNDPLLCRAISISSDILQHMELGNLPPDLYPYLCTPKELYEDLKAKGYDWDVLLNTRGYWLFEEDLTDDDLPPLTTMDLLRMRAGDFHPPWLEKPKQS